MLYHVLDYKESIHKDAKRGGRDQIYIFLIMSQIVKKIDKRHGFYIIGTNNLMAEDWIDRE